MNLCRVQHNSNKDRPGDFLSRCSLHWPPVSLVSLHSSSLCHCSPFLSRHSYPACPHLCSPLLLTLLSRLRLVSSASRDSRLRLVSCESSDFGDSTEHRHTRTHAPPAGGTCPRCLTASYISTPLLITSSHPLLRRRVAMLTMRCDVRDMSADEAEPPLHCA